MKSNIIYIILLGLLSASIGCKKFVDIPPPRTSINEELVFNDNKTADASVAGMYASMNAYNSSFANSQANTYPSFSADDFFNSNPSADADEFKANTLSIGNGIIDGLWSDPYALIYHANAVMEGLSDAPNVTPAIKSQLLGEAKFIRAFCYFYLVNYFGNVPLVLNTDFKVNSNLPRDSANVVYDTIVKDLQDAQLLLGDNYPGNLERIRANKTVATALLARVFLYRGIWDKAETEATKVLGDGRYKLVSLNQVFLKNSQEALLQLAAINTTTGGGGINTWEAFNIIPTTPTTLPTYQMYPNFRTSFEATDNRATSWLASYTPSGGGTTLYYPFKYKVRLSVITVPLTPPSEYSMVLRRAEQFLIRAEAKVQQGKLAEAKSDLDSIRLRAGLPVLAAGLSKDDLILAVAKERKLELFTEWGHRWLDLKRTGKAISVLTPLKPGIRETDLLYPIPITATLTNGNLKQNAGYPR